MRTRFLFLVLSGCLVAGSCGGGSTAEPVAGGPAPTTTTTTATTPTPPTTTSTTAPITTTTTTAAPAPTPLEAGLLCSDVAAAGYGFAEALAYWVREGMPERMDADGNGVPCETVYAAAERNAVLAFEAGAPLQEGLLCGDLAASGYGFAAALAYWVRQGTPDRMDADHNRLPCETVYEWSDIVAVIGFDGALYESPPPREGATVATIVAAVQERLDAEFAAQDDPPEGVLGPIRLTCDDADRIVRLGDVFACAGLPQTTPGFQLDSVGIVFLVLDDDGAVSATWGTDVPDSTPALEAMYDEVGTGLSCRDLVDSDRAGFFSGCCGTPLGNYSRALLYWFMDGMPDRMDADRNGIPCESVFPTEGIEATWNGGALPAS